MPKEKIKVSIIVPMYNVEDYLENSIESFVNQSLQDIEIILIDDGSPDKSGIIADEYSKKDKRIKVIHKKNGGVSAARNDGLKIASGEYVIFCDPDDWMENKACEKLYSAAKRNDADISIGDIYMVNSSRERNYIKFYSNKFVTQKKEDIKELIKADINRTYCPNPPSEGYAFGYGGPWNKLVRRQLLIDNNIKFDIRTKGVFDDIIYTAYILEHAKKVCYISYPVYNYRQVDSSITNSYKANILEINNLIFKSLEEYLNKYDSDGEYREPYYACVIRRISETLKLYFLSTSNPKTKKELKKEYLNMINSKPYKTALKKADLDKLSKRQKLIKILSKKGAIWLLWLIFTLYYKKA